LASGTEIVLVADAVVVSLDPVDIVTGSVELFKEVAEYGGVSLAVMKYSKDSLASALAVA